MKYTDYTTYKPEDFIQDDYFLAWCSLNPSLESQKFWESWMERHPDQRQDIESAKQIAIDLYNAQKSDSSSSMTIEIWDKIEKNISTEKKKPFLYYIKVLSSSAAVLLVLFMAYNWTSPSDSYNTDGWSYHQNTSNTQEILTLSDGTILTLEPQTTIKYLKSFAANKREVILEGEAFFDVAKDKTKPFLIYAQQTITKVLGTSFSIVSEKGKDVEVEVSSGKVAVYFHKNKSLVANDDAILSQKIIPILDKKNRDLKILTPNQKAVFIQKDKKLIRTITKKPNLVHKLTELPKIQFKNEPVNTIFSTIENAYGISIKYDINTIKSCSISTILGKEPMITQLEMICMALDLQMHETDGVINITGKGCSK